MGLLLNLVLSIASAVLHFVAALDVAAFTPWGVYQPKAPKSLLR